VWGDTKKAVAGGSGQRQQEEQAFGQTFHSRIPRK